MFSVGLVLAFAGMCLCSQSTGSYQSPAIQQTQIKLEDIERDNLDSAYVQKLQQQGVKSSTAAPATALQQQQSYQPQYFSQQPYQAQQQQQYFLQQPYQQAQHQYLAQPYQSVAAAFDYPGIQYMFINPSTYNPTNQLYQQFYVPSAAAQPSAVPQYVTKQTSPVQYQLQQTNQQQLQFAAPQEYKQQTQFVAPVRGQQAQFAAAPAQAQQVEFKQQQYTAQAPAFQYAQAPSASAAATPNDFSYITRHPVATPSAAAVQFKAPFQAPAPAVQYKPQVTAPAAAAIQPQFQYNAAVQPQFQFNTAAQPQFQFNAAAQPQFQYQQPQFYYTAPAAATPAPAVQQSVKSQFSSGIKSTTPFPVKEFAYKFETPQQIPQQQQQQQQQSGALYSTIKYSA